MNEPRRLIDEASGDELETSLLSLARSEGPSPAGRKKILAAIAAAGATASTATPAQAAEATKLAGKGLSAGLKWGLLGLFMLAIPAALWLRAGAPPAASQATGASQQKAASEPATQPALPTSQPAQDASQPSPDPAPVALSDLPALPAPAAPSGALSGAKAQGSLAEEVAQLQRAKLALKAGSGSQALSELETYARRFPQPMLGAEATVVRIEALRATGNDARARALARSFLAKNPNSPYAARLKALAGVD